MSFPGLSERDEEHLRLHGSIDLVEEKLVAPLVSAAAHRQSGVRARAMWGLAMLTQRFRQRGLAEQRELKLVCEAPGPHRPRSEAPCVLAQDELLPRLFQHFAVWKSKFRGKLGPF